MRCAASLVNRGLRGRVCEEEDDEEDEEARIEWLYILLTKTAQCVGQHVLLDVQAAVLALVVWQYTTSISTHTESTFHPRQRCVGPVGSAGRRGRCGTPNLALHIQGYLALETATP